MVYFKSKQRPKLVIEYLVLKLGVTASEQKEFSFTTTNQSLLNHFIKERTDYTYIQYNKHVKRND